MPKMGHLSDEKVILVIRYNVTDANKYAKYLVAIEEAEANYAECESKKCKCFGDVITRDLKVFAERGIGQKLIEAARSR